MHNMLQITIIISIYETYSLCLKRMCNIVMAQNEHKCFSVVRVCALNGRRPSSMSIAIECNPDLQ